MPIYNKLSAVRKLSNSSLTSIIDITNLNFADLSSATLEFLNKINYNETTNSFSAYTGDFDFVNVADKFSLKLDGIPTFTIDSLGRAEGQEILVKVAETKRLRLTDFNDWPDVGVPGEIIYTGIQNQRPEFGEDFIGYLQSKGWVSLTEPGTASFITLYELMGSPPVPACPSPNTGILWIGPPGYATASVPTTQTIYYTDENCEVYDLTLGTGGSGGGTGANCSYVALANFNANTPLTITHNLNTTSILLQLIDTSNNELIEAYVDNYQANSVAVTLTQTLANVKIVIIGECNGAAESVTKSVLASKETNGELVLGKSYLITDSTPFTILTTAQTTTQLSRTGTILDPTYAGIVNYDAQSSTMQVVSATDSIIKPNLYLGVNPADWTLGAGANTNTFNVSSGGVLGSLSAGNTFEKGADSNTLGDSASYNTFKEAAASNTLGDNSEYNIFENGASNNTLGIAAVSNTFKQTVSGLLFGDNLKNVTIEPGIVGADYTASPAYDFLYNKDYSSKIFFDGTDNHHSYYDTTKDQIVLTNLSTLTTSYIGAPASPNKSVQFNNSGVFGGSTSLTFDSPTAQFVLLDTLNAGLTIQARNLSNGASAYSQLFLQGGASTNGIQNGIFTFNQLQTINTYLRSSSLISTVASDLGNTNVAKQIYFIAAANSGSQFEWHYNTGNTLSAGSIRMYLTSGGALWTNGSASATALTIRNTPTANPSGTQVLVRNTSTGNVEYRTYGGLYSQTAQSAAIAATVAESSLIGTGVGSLTVPANGFVVGDSFHAKLFGEVSSANTQTLQIRVKSGSVVLADFGAYSMPSTSNRSYELNITFTIRAIGAAGVAVIATNGTFLFTHGGGNNVEANKVNTVNSTTFDTTASNVLDITLQWGSTNATNTIHTDQFVLHKIY